MQITSNELRQKFINFFESYPNLEHQKLDSAPLVPSEEEQLEGKEKVLFTSAGMQPLIPYLTGKKNPPSSRLVDCQKCLRTDDIEEVGDNTHHTFFEMLGNWSIGDYWKKEAIEMSFNFLTKELEIPIEKLAVSVFAGDEDAPIDEESAGIWKSLGIPEDRISFLGKEHNWWPTAKREQDSGEFKNPFGPCGPDTEMFYWTGEEEPLGKPDNDDRWVEIWNDVFMQYNRKEDGTLEDLPQRNVDTGMGLERTLAVLNGFDNDYETDLFEPIISKLRGASKSFNIKDARIIADHIKASVFLISERVKPSNKERGYVLRRLIRRAATKAFLIDKEKSDSKFFKSLISSVVDIYPYLNKNDIETEFTTEILKYRNTLERGLKEVEKVGKIDGKIAFDLYQSYGFPLEITEELFQEKGQKIDHTQFEAEFKKHQELSRTASAGMFKGGLAGHSEVEIKYHTATHLLHQALRDVLGETVFQKGSNINPERLRFDFSFDRKMTEEEIRKVEEIINQKIKESLQVDNFTTTVKEAYALNAIGLFDEKYGTEVKIYAIGPNYKLNTEALDQRDRGGYYSLEFCGGPHVKNTSEIGSVKITKEEAVSQGIRRIKAELI